MRLSHSLMQAIRSPMTVLMFLGRQKQNISGLCAVMCIVIVSAFAVAALPALDHLSLPAFVSADGGGDNIMSLTIPQIPPNIRAALNLTGEQESNIGAVLARHNSESQVLNRQLQEARLGLNEAVMGNVLDQNAIRQRTQDLISAWSSLIESESQVGTQARSFLTPTQIETYNRLRDDMRAREPRIPEIPLARIGDPIVRSIAFTAQQAEERNAVLRKHQEQSADANRLVFAKKVALEKAIMSEPFDESNVKVLTREYSDAQAGLVTLQIAVFVELRSSMTGAQVARFLELSQQENGRLGRFTLP